MGEPAAYEQLDDWAGRIDRLTGASLQNCALELVGMIRLAEEVFERLQRQVLSLEERVDALGSEVKQLGTACARLLDSHTHIRAAVTTVEAAARAITSAPKGITLVHNADVLPAAAKAT